MRVYTDFFSFNRILPAGFVSGFMFVCFLVVVFLSTLHIVYCFCFRSVIEYDLHTFSQMTFLFEWNDFFFTYTGLHIHVLFES